MLTATNLIALLNIQHLNPNGLDNEFFYSNILKSPSDPTRGTAKSTRGSHERIANAAKLAAERVRTIAEGRSEDAAEKLGRWRRFIDNHARVIWIEVPDDNTAFIIFETGSTTGGSNYQKLTS